MTSTPAAPLLKLEATGMHAVRRQCSWRGFTSTARRTRRRVWRRKRIEDFQGQLIGFLPWNLRGEGSTAWQHNFAALTGRDFFSVDFATEGYENARRVCGPCAHRGLGECRWLLAGACDASAHSCYAMPDHLDGCVRIRMHTCINVRVWRWGICGVRCDCTSQ